jgi:hypothetical protein
VDLYFLERVQLIVLDSIHQIHLAVRAISQLLKLLKVI